MASATTAIQYTACYRVHSKFGLIFWVGRNWGNWASLFSQKHCETEALELDFPRLIYESWKM